MKQVCLQVFPNVALFAAVHRSAHMHDYAISIQCLTMSHTYLHPLAST